MHIVPPFPWAEKHWRNSLCKTTAAMGGGGWGGVSTYWSRHPAHDSILGGFFMSCSQDVICLRSGAIYSVKPWQITPGSWAWSSEILAQMSLDKETLDYYSLTLTTDFRTCPFLFNFWTNLQRLHACKALVTFFTGLCLVMKMSWNWR